MSVNQSLISDFSEYYRWSQRTKIKYKLHYGWCTGRLTIHFEDMVNRIYPPELHLNKANTFDTEAQFLDLHLSISNGFVSSKIYDKRDDFDFSKFSIFGWWCSPFYLLQGLYFSTYSVC